MTKKGGKEWKNCLKLKRNWLVRFIKILNSLNVEFFINCEKTLSANFQFAYAFILFSKNSILILFIFILTSTI